MIRPTRRYTHAVVPHVLRMIALRRAGLSCKATAIVVNLDQETDYNEVQVRNYTRRYAAGSFRPATATVSKDTGKNLPRKQAA